MGADRAERLPGIDLQVGRQVGAADDHARVDGHPITRRRGAEEFDRRRIAGVERAAARFGERLEHGEFVVGPRDHERARLAQPDPSVAGEP